MNTEQYSQSFPSSSCSLKRLTVVLMSLKRQGVCVCRSQPPPQHVTVQKEHSQWKECRKLIPFHSHEISLRPFTPCETSNTQDWLKGGVLWKCAVSPLPH